MKKISIAIDGPAASGKSTTARLLANRLEYIYVDTGAMYRAATLAVLNDGVDIKNEGQVVLCVSGHQIEIRMSPAGQHTYLDNEDVNNLIRAPQINNTISAISSYAGVRKVMLEQQRELAKSGGVVMDGRDIGTIVLPHAELKVFMIATLKERAGRRKLELEGQGINVSLQEVEEEITRRDALDVSRSQAPLKKAADAREIDTSQLTIEEQVDKIYQWALVILSLSKGRHVHPSTGSG